ncbi:MAG: ABC transporter permease [Gemmatimonadaceae bacterium]
MSPIPNLRRVLRLPRNPEQIDADLDAELGFHFEMMEAELRARGVPADEARREARRRFGDVAFTREYCRDLDRRHEREVRLMDWFFEIRQDARYAVRKLLKSPGFTLVAVVTLALGIGATASIFSVVNGVLLRPLPFEEQDRIVRMNGWSNGRRQAISPLDYTDWRDGTSAFEATSIFDYGIAMNLTERGAEAERLEAATVSPDFFKVLRMRPALGRAFGPADGAAGAPKVAVLTEGLWRRRFGADPAILGRAITLNGESHTVVGVLSGSEIYPGGTDVYVPFSLDAVLATSPSRGARWLVAAGRLKPGVSIERAQAELDAVAARVAADNRNTNLNFTAKLVPLHEQITGTVKKPLYVLLGAVAFVMLIACANVANLLLARAAGRETEIAVRTAIGASRGRIVRQLVTESAILSLAGAAVGLGLAAWWTKLFVRLAGQALPRLAQARVDGRVLLATILAAIITGVVFGLAPALHAAKGELAASLKEGSRGAAGRRESKRMRAGLVVAELALAVVLLAGAGLLIRSFNELRKVDPGFRPEHVLTFNVTLPEAKYPHTRLADVTAAIVREVRQIPGVSAAAASYGTPLGYNAMAFSYEIPSHPPRDETKSPVTTVRPASPEYFAAMGIPLLRGRGFTDTDRKGSAPVLVVSRALVEDQFANEDPIGKEIHLDWTGDDETRRGGTIIGVVGDAREAGPDRPVRPMTYLPFAQVPLRDVSITLRTTGNPTQVAAAARERVKRVDADLPVYQVRTMEAAVAESMSQPRFYTLLLGAFATVALVLAAVGIYGVIAYTVALRTREIGVRMALGATGRHVVRMVMREGMALTLVGVLIGLAGALATSRLLRSLLFEISPTDPLALAGGGVLLALVAVLACIVPARRATRVDPLVAMRAE